MTGLSKFSDRIIYWSIVLIPFSIAVAPFFTYAFIGFLSIFFIVKKITRKEKPFIANALNLAVLGLILVSLISFKNSIDYRASLQGMIKLVRNSLLMFIVMQEIKDKQHVRRIALAIILGASLASFDGAWQVIFGRDFIRGHAPIINIGLRRATAAFPDANVFGVYLSALTPLVAGLSLFYFKGRKKIMMLLASALVFLGVALSFSRGTALAVYCALLFISVCRRNKFISIMLLIILLAGPFAAPKSIKEWAREADYNPIIFMCNRDRISIYRNALNMIKHHPFIGVGVNTFSKNYLKYKLPEAEGARTGDTMYAHNHFLHMAGEIGLLGLGIFLWFLWRVFKKGAHIFSLLNDDYLKIVSLSLIACLIAFLINGLTETSLYYSRVAMIFWYLAGFLLALDKVSHAS